MKKRILNILIVVLALVFVGSGAFVGINLYMYHRQQQTFDQLAEELPEEETAPVIELVEVPPIEVPAQPPVPSARITDEIIEDVTEDAADAADTTADTDLSDEAAIAAEAYAQWADLPVAQGAVSEPVYAPLTFSSQEWNSWWLAGFEDRQPVYHTLQEQNPDVVGWVRIEGTRINYPVCQTRYEPEKYLHLDVNGTYSSYGTPFMDAACRLSPRSSLLIYGHHMRNGSMFAALQNYTSSSYYQAHPFIQFDTVDEPATYQIALVIKVDAEGTYLSWQDLLFPEDEETFNYALWFALLNRYYDTGVSIEYGDQLLALVTCEYTQENGRLMVIAKRIW